MMFNLTNPDRVIRVGVILLKGFVDSCYRSPADIY